VRNARPGAYIKIYSTLHAQSTESERAAAKRGTEAWDPFAGGRTLAARRSPSSLYINFILLLLIPCFNSRPAAMVVRALEALWECAASAFRGRTPNATASLPSQRTQPRTETHAPAFLYTQRERLKFPCTPKESQGSEGN
jgi:hypothetical protein